MTDAIFIEGRNIRLRPVEESDICGPYSRWLNDQESDLFTEHAVYPHTAEELRDYVRGKRADRSALWLAIAEKSSGSHAGNIELSEIDRLHRAATVNILIGREYQGRGYGSEAVRLICSHAFAKLNLHRITAGVNAQNAASLAMFEKIGFRREGMLRERFLRAGKFYDIVMLGLLENEFNEGSVS